MSTESYRKKMQEFKRMREAVKLPNQFIDFTNFAFDHWTQLIEDNLTMLEALEFYSNSDNWGHVSPDSATYSVVDAEDLGKGDFMLNENVDDERVGGRRAREALAKIRGEE